MVEEQVHIVTTETIPGYKITGVKGLVWGSSVRAKFILQDLKAMARTLVGGEVKEYWELLNEARWEIIKKINQNALALEANAVVGLKMMTSQIIPGTIEIMAYGTAVVIEKTEME